MKSKETNYFSYLFSQFWDDFVKIKRTPVEPFNKQMTKSVYHDCNKIN